MIRVLTAGTWDLFHIGHLNIIKESIALGTELFVGVSSDELVEKQKGHKPLIPAKQRIEIIKNIVGVDTVYEQYEILPTYDVKSFSPDIITIGSDWEGKELEGLTWFKENDGTVMYLPYTDGVNTTDLKERILAS